MLPPSVGYPEDVGYDVEHIHPSVVSLSEICMYCPGVPSDDKAHLVSKWEGLTIVLQMVTFGSFHENHCPCGCGRPHTQQEVTHVNHFLPSFKLQLK
jgi:hypothetical protein